MNAKQEPREEISYKLLEEISREGTVSQRALADRLGIALGLVNAYVKRLCSKGYLKLKFLPKNRIKYIITPQGFAEKSRLTYKYMHYSNGGIDKPNNGIDAHVIGMTFRY